MNHTANIDRNTLGFFLKIDMKTKQCFIHLNTKELRERIEKENIKIAHTSITESREYGLLFNGKLVLGTPKYLDNRTITEYLTEFKKDIKDCGTDQEMFIKTIKKIQNNTLCKNLF